MRAIRRNNATGMFSWIGSDGWSARNLVSDGNEPEVIEDIIYFIFCRFKTKRCYWVNWPI